MTEVKSKSSENANPSEADKLIGIIATMACGVVLFVIIIMGFLMANLIADAPRQDRIRSLREATCAKNGMILLEDKYHPAVCAFHVDEEGMRIPD
ncbi:hypothetical protein HFN89_05575 [Rhizobium laguerreae]|nr:hypothetical protein [Rhizobium laguerreae]